MNRKEENGRFAVPARCGWQFLATAVRKHFYWVGRAKRDNDIARVQTQRNIYLAVVGDTLN